jgi:hypothetical protein
MEFRASKAQLYTCGSVPAIAFNRWPWALYLELIRF